MTANTNYDPKTNTWVDQDITGFTRGPDVAARKHASSRVLEFTPPAFSELPIADQSRSPLIECQRSETGAQLRAAVARLPETYRIVILLRDLEDLGISEVAGRLGLTISA